MEKKKKEKSAGLRGNNKQRVYGLSASISVLADPHQQLPHVSSARCYIRFKLIIKKKQQHCIAWERASSEYTPSLFHQDATAKS